MEIVTCNAFGLPGELIVAIQDSPSFYSLYADGLFSRKVYDNSSGTSLFSYAPGAAIFLFYTYPTHRAVSLIRNIPGYSAFPGLSKKVSTVFTVHASKVDKLRRSIGYLNKHAGGAYRFTDDFYVRLYFILHKRGKLNYIALRKLTEKCHEGEPYVNTH